MAETVDEARSSKDDAKRDHNMMRVCDIGFGYRSGDDVETSEDDSGID